MKVQAGRTSCTCYFSDNLDDLLQSDATEPLRNSFVLSVSDLSCFVAEVAERRRLCTTPCIFGNAVLRAALMKRDRASDPEDGDLYEDCELDVVEALSADEGDVMRLGGRISWNVVGAAWWSVTTDRLVGGFRLSEEYYVSKRLQILRDITYLKRMRKLLGDQCRMKRRPS